MLQPNQVLDQCDSTNDLAKKLAEEGAPHGSWISASRQTLGRGRLGRRWESVTGNLFLSIVVRIPDRFLWTWVPLTTALGVVRYLSLTFPKLELQIKWPNDLLLSGKKVGGILCESSSTSIVIGIGLNCSHAPSSPEFQCTDLSSAHFEPITADSIRMGIIGSVVQEIDRLMLKGSAQSESEYWRWAVLKKGTLVQWGEGHESGVILGLGPSGELEVETDLKEKVALFAEEVSLRKKPQNQNDFGASRGGGGYSS
ncbi:MAG: biotin--[acetyl-CoA-carboxylase] ligase [Bdellovibrionia bacterium]